MTSTPTDDTFLFLEDDLATLRVKVAELEKTYKETLSGVHDSTTQSSETWHDNPVFDDVQQRSRMFHNQFRKMKAILDVAVLAEPAPDADEVVGLGSRVHVIVNERAKFDVIVCSYRCFHEGDDDTEYVSYVAPLATALIGKRVGDTGSYTTGERTMKVEITGVESPSASRGATDADIAALGTPYVLGIAGPGGAGKDIIGQKLEARGFIHVSASDMLREEISRDHGLPDRMGQGEFANRLRTKFGSTVLIERAYEKASSAPPSNSSTEGRPSIAISGIYCVSEAKYIVETLGGVLVYVDADPEERFARLVRRSDGNRDQMTRERFDETERVEMSGTSDDEMNLLGVRDLARFEIANEGTLDELDAKIGEVAESLVEAQ